MALFGYVLVFAFWHLCRAMRLRYSTPGFSIVAAIYSLLLIHTAKFPLKTCILWVHENFFLLSALGRCKFVPLSSTESTALPWIHSSCLLLYSLPIRCLHGEKYSMKIILKMVHFCWHGHTYFEDEASIKVFVTEVKN